ncbi:MAG: hypothetical protein KDB53_01755, partial [Planctomycetes bacterium]|nr:hypothetical protein [Planctomycetota bacterium]
MSGGVDSSVAAA